MPRPKRPWFRFYVEATRDPKLRRLTPAQRWLWIAVLSAARESCMPGWLMLSVKMPLSAADLADYAGMTVREVAKGLSLMDDMGLIEMDPNLNAWLIPRWSERQYESDDVSVRTARHRSHGTRRNVPTLLPGTPPETEAESRDR